MSEFSVDSAIPEKLDEWGPEIFFEYVKASLRGRNFLHKHNEYPKVIDPAKIEAEIEQARKTSANDPKRRETSNKLVLGHDLLTPYVLDRPSKGTTGSIPHSVLKAQISKAEAKGLSPVTGYVGIHTHPRDIDMAAERITNSLRQLVSKQSKLTNEQPSFSLSDVFILIRGYGIYEPITIVAEPADTLMICQARDTKTIYQVEPDYPVNYEKFAEHWYKQGGWKYTGTDEAGENATEDSPIALTMEEIIKRVCYKHNLVYYRGSPGKPLVRQDL